jgi:hypothetical protein
MRLSIVSVLFAISLILLSVAGSSPLSATNGPRNLIVFFEFLDNANGVEEAVDYIFNQMIGPSDQLIIQSPARVYGFSRATLSKPKAELIAMMQEKLRGDIAKGTQSYKQVINDLKLASRNIEAMAMPADDAPVSLPEVRDLGELIMVYRQGLANMNQLRKVNDASLRQLANAFRGQKGENHLIILFEREFRPVPNRVTLNVLADMPKLAFQANELFLTGNLKEPFDIAALAGYFKQIPLTQHFVYITSKNDSSNSSQLENSGDIYAAFSKIAKETGGICETTSEPVTGLESIIKALNEAK